MEVQTLNSLKGVPLLNAEGYIFIISSYELEEREHEEGHWFRSKKVKTLDVASVTYNTSGKILVKEFDLHATITASLFVQYCLKSRDRYLIMLKSLSNIGYTIKKK